MRAAWRGPWVRPRVHQIAQQIPIHLPRQARIHLPALLQPHRKTPPPPAPASPPAPAALFSLAAAPRLAPCGYTSESARRRPGSCAPTFPVPLSVRGTQPSCGPCARQRGGRGPCEGRGRGRARRWRGGGGQWCRRCRIAAFSGECWPAGTVGSAPASRRSFTMGASPVEAALERASTCCQR